MKLHFIITFEDKGQDTTKVLASFDSDYVLGQIIDSNLNSVEYNWQYILSGKPEIGGHLVLSKHPKSATWLSWDIENIEPVSHKIMDLPNK